MAGTRCTVCDHPERPEIDAALPVSSVRNIAKRWSLSPAAIHRHKVKHSQPAVARIAQERADLSAAAVLDRLMGLLESAESGVEKAHSKGDLRALAALLREARETLVRLGQVSAGLWSERGVAAVNVEKMQINVASLTTDELRALARRSLPPPTIEGEAC